MQPWGFALHLLTKAITKTCFYPFKNENRPFKQKCFSGKVGVTNFENEKQ